MVFFIFNLGLLSAMSLVYFKIMLVVNFKFAWCYESHAMIMQTYNKSNSMKIFHLYLGSLF